MVFEINLLDAWSIFLLLLEMYFNDTILEMVRCQFQSVIKVLVALFFLNFFTCIDRIFTQKHT